MTIDPTKVPVFILAGGLGTRLSEETHLVPKPMIEIGGLPILVHIMRWYHSFGFNDFVICAGYKSWEIKQYFLNYSLRQSHLEVDMRAKGEPKINSFLSHQTPEKWRIRVINTGLEAMTGARIARAFDAIYSTDKFDHFAMTYGDGVCDVNLEDELNFHIQEGRVGTVMGVSPPSRFGEMTFDKSKRVTGFTEKPQNTGGGINGGYFFFTPTVRKYLTDEDTLIFEREPMESLANAGELALYQHAGFWQCMDTLRDKHYLQDIWDSGNAPWQSVSPA